MKNDIVENMPIKEKIKHNIHICSKCYDETEWTENCCPSCGNNKFLPYYEIQGSELRRK